ncbi:MAG: hypothetical protein ABSG33_04575 [Candidatus Bathyarchaeia archaeon]
MKGEKEGQKLNYVETEIPQGKNRGISDLAFFNNMRKNLEEVP